MNYTKYLFICLLVAAITVWLGVIKLNENLQVIACDVGQGDAFLIQKNNLQVLIDGGPSSKVVGCLDQYISFWDRNIDLVILTHPQKDHYKGLIDVFEKYKVENILISGLDSSSNEYRVLDNLVGGGKTKVLYSTDVKSLRLGLMQLDILHPSKSFMLANSTSKKTENAKKEVLGLFTSEDDPNEFCIVILLSYKNFDALFTGDIDHEISDQIADKLVFNNSKIEYLKVPHHGSRNGLSRKLLEAVNPSVAVISAGKNNSYGHPHKELLEMLSEKNIKTLRTDEKGNIETISDGQKWWLN